MTCEDYVEAMSAFLDGVPDGKLEAHLAACPACRRELESLRRANTALRDFPALAWKPAMTELILRRARPRRLWLPLAAAALLAVTIAFLAWPRPAVPRNELEQHVAAVKLLAKEAEDPNRDPAVLRAEVEHLRLRELTEILAKSDAPAEVRAYLAETKCFLSTIDGEPYDRLVTLNFTASSIGFHYNIEPTSVRITGTTSTDLDLYALGRLQLANGDVSGGSTTLNVLIETRPSSLYTIRACRILGKVYVAKGDPVEAVATYVSLKHPTNDVAIDLKNSSTSSGIVFVGADRVDSLDAGEVLRRLTLRMPVAVVREMADKKREVSVVGESNVDELRRLGSSRVRGGDRRRGVIDPREFSDADLDMMQVEMRAMIHALKQEK